MIQMPCPEMNELGINRPPMSYEDYDKITGYRERCKFWLEPVFSQIQSYIENGDKFKGVIGINQSPNCSISGQRGIFMEILFEWLVENDLTTSYLEVPTWYTENEEENFQETILYFLKEI